MAAFFFFEKDQNLKDFILATLYCLFFFILPILQMWVFRLEEMWLF